MIDFDSSSVFDVWCSVRENLVFFLRLYDSYATWEANINAIAYCTRVTLLIDEN